jgi:protocatechuate 3,4-dioxygenase beta subunit
VASLVVGQTAVEDYQVSGVVVDHLTRKPLRNILVQLVRSSKGGGNASAITSEDGCFLFLHAPQGKYQLSAAKRGQMPQSFGQSDGGYATAIVVDGRQKTDGIVFTMRTDASISGSVMGEDGEPVSGATVQLYREVVNEGEAQTVEQARVNTNSSGQFHFGHLEAGNYYLSGYGTPWFSQAGVGPEVVYPVIFYGDTSDANAARVIALPEGGQANLQINLRTAPGIRVKLAEHTQNFRLFVPGPGGSQIPVNTFIAGNGMNYGNNGMMFAAGASGPVDAPHPMELFNLAAGRYLVNLTGQYGGPGQVMETVDLANGSTLSIDSAATTSITGKVLFDGTRPKGNLAVLLNNGRTNLDAPVAEDGTFKFDHAAPGAYAVYLGAQDLAISSVTARGARMVHDKVEVQPGASVELTVKTVSSQSLATLEGFAVHDGAGIPGAMVLLLPQDLGKDQLIRRDQSDADGSFTLARIAPGRYTLVAIDDGRQLAYKTESVIKPYLGQGLAVTIPLPSNAPLQVPVQARKR